MHVLGGRQDSRAHMGKPNALTAILLLATPVAHAAMPKGRCHIPCKMDGVSGRCKTNYCGAGNLCCKLGYVQPPCDGIAGCDDYMCCTAASEIGAHKSLPPSTAPSPIALPPAASSWTQECNFARLGFELRKAIADSEFVHASASVTSTPWIEDMHVVLLIKSRGE